MKKMMFTRILAVSMLAVPVASAMETQVADESQVADTTWKSEDIWKEYQILSTLTEAQ